MKTWRLGLLLAGLLLAASARGSCSRQSPTPAHPTATPTDQTATLPTASAIPTVAAPAPTAVPTRPPAPLPSKEAAYRPQWTEADIRLLDPWGDAGGDEQDLVALFFRQQDGLLRFRVDFLDLKAQSIPDLNLALAFVRGGVTALAPDSLASDLSWDLLVQVTGGESAQVLSASFRPVPDAVAGVAADPTLDYVTIDLRRDAIPIPISGAFRFQALALTPGAAPQIVDRTEPAGSDANVSGRATMIMDWANFLGPGYPLGVEWYDSKAVDRDGVLKPKGFRYVLDAVENYWVPISVNAKQMQYLAWTEGHGIYDRLRALNKVGLVEMPDTLAYGHFMAWQPQDVDAKAIALERTLYRQLDLPPSTVFVPYETGITVADLDVIRDAGYEALAAFESQGYARWFGESGGDPVRLERKLHRANGLNLIFGPGPFSFIWEPRWGEDPYKDWDKEDPWRGTDGGLHYSTRRVLLDRARDPDQEQFMYYGTDIGVTPWAFQGIAEDHLRWIVEHPWIKMVRVDQLLHQGWTVMDHGKLEWPPETVLWRVPLEGDAHYNSYFPQFYYGGVADGHSPLAAKGQVIESYADYVPYWREGQRIPSGRKMGDDTTPDSIVYETLRNLRSAPENEATTLAWLSYFSAIGEQTFHSIKDHTPHDPDMERNDVPYGGAYLHPKAKMSANSLRQVNKLVAAARWADAVRRGDMPSKAAIQVADLDLDGETEYVLRNDRLFLVFEDDGGRLEYGFLFVPGRGPVQVIGPKDQFFPAGISGASNWDWTRGEAGQDAGYPAFVGAFVE